MVTLNKDAGMLHEEETAGRVLAKEGSVGHAENVRV